MLNLPLIVLGMMSAIAYPDIQNWWLCYYHPSTHQNFNWHCTKNRSPFAQMQKYLTISLSITTVSAQYLLGSLHVSNFSLISHLRVEDHTSGSQLLAHKGFHLLECPFSEFEIAHLKGSKNLSKLIFNTRSINKALNWWLDGCKESHHHRWIYTTEDEVTINKLFKLLTMFTNTTE